MENQKKRILIVEDEPAMLRVLTDAISENAFTPLTASTGTEGLIIALQQHPDLLILDVLMPQMDGMTTLKKLREDDWGKTVPVIMLTNVSPDTDTALQEITQNQPAYYFMKADIQLDALITKIKEILT